MECLNKDTKKEKDRSCKSGVEIIKSLPLLNCLIIKYEFYAFSGDFRDH